MEKVVVSAVSFSQKDIDIKIKHLHSKDNLPQLLALILFHSLIS
jgi:hypothetical protein